jgi:hypothetical protein
MCLRRILYVISAAQHIHRSQSGDYGAHSPHRFRPASTGLLTRVAASGAYALPNPCFTSPVRTRTYRRRTVVRSSNLVNHMKPTVQTVGFLFTGPAPAPAHNPRIFRGVSRWRSLSLSGQGLRPDGPDTPGKAPPGRNRSRLSGETLEMIQSHWDFGTSPCSDTRPSTWRPLTTKPACHRDATSCT